MVRRLESSERSGCQDLSALEEKRCMNMSVWQVQILKSDDGNSNIENVYES